VNFLTLRIFAVTISIRLTYKLRGLQDTANKFYCTPPLRAHKMASKQELLLACKNVNARFLPALLPLSWDSSRRQPC